MDKKDFADLNINMTLGHNHVFNIFLATTILSSHGEHTEPQSVDRDIRTCTH